MRPRLYPVDEGRLFRGYRIGCAASALGVLSQTKAARIGDAIRRELGQALYDRPARWRVKPVNPCPKMCTSLIIIISISAKQMAKMPLAKHQDMAKAFPSNRSDQPHPWTRLCTELCQRPQTSFSSESPILSSELCPGVHVSVS